jgi:hypothetical protein
VNKARRKTPNKELHNKTALRVIPIHFSIKTVTVLIIIIIIIINIIIDNSSKSSNKQQQ